MVEKNVPDLNITHDNDGNPIYQGSTTLFDETGYDEMQRTENHEIGFKLFRVMFFVVLAFAMVLIIVCGSSGNVAGMVIALVLFAVVFGFYVLYAYMTAKKGIMNPKFAKSWSGTWILFFCPIMYALWVIRLIGAVQGERELSEIANCSMWLILVTQMMLMCLCAKKNKKVVEEQLKDD